MAEAISLCRAEGQPWGFRLTGGADFGAPLAVIKLVQGSVAARAGLHVGDMILSLNDVPLGQMTHAQATDYIVKAGNMFKISVIRGSFISPPQLVKSQQSDSVTSESTDSACLIASPDQEDIELPVVLANIISEGLQEQQAHLVDEPISEQQQEQQSDEPVLSVATEQEAQCEAAAPSEAPAASVSAPEEHIEYTEEEIAEMMSGCAEVLMGSCIGVDFQKLPPDTDIMKSEVLHLLIEEKIDKPKKTLSTFNQRPNNPKPKPKGEPAVKPPPYLPLKYVPQKKKPEPEVPSTEQVPAQESADPEVKEEEVPQDQGEEGKTGEEEGVEVPESQEETNPCDETGEEMEEEKEEQVTTEEAVTVVDATDIESQLAEIQNQLAAIIQLPVEIQQHLSFIQQQLAKILELRAAELAAEKQEAEDAAALLEEEVPEGMEENQDMEGEEGESHEEGEGECQVEQVEELVEEEPEPEPEPEKPKHKRDIEWKKEEPEKRRPFFPLTPQPRPVQLPGGRKWFAPKDVYTEDFIAETISGNEEIILGTTIGVDFHKFDRNYDHLKSSSVYKMVHDSEDGKKRVPGTFPDRTDKSHAKEDYVVASDTPTDSTPAQENEQ